MMNSGILHQESSTKTIMSWFSTNAPEKSSKGTRRETSASLTL